MTFRRGQAFETMMLVISVIVALAILAVLMNIIGGIGGIGQGEPDKLMHDRLKDIATTGYGCSAPTKTIIKRGTTIFAKQVRSDIVSIQDGDTFVFDVDNTAGTGIVGLTGATGTVAAVKLQASSAMTSAEAQVFFVVCGDAGASKPTYKVCIGARETSGKVTGCTP